MKHLILPIAAGLGLTAGPELATQYQPDSAVRIETQSVFQIETVSFSMERDGEPMEGFGDRGGNASETVRNIVQIDRVLETKDGAPIRVERTYEEVGGESISSSFDGEPRETELESPFEGVVLELTLNDDGEVEVEVADGDEPEADDALEGHRLELALDAFLPADSVELEEAWDLDTEAVRAALETELSNVLFPRPSMEDREGEGGGPRGGGRGGRGGRGGTSTRVLGLGEWEGQAKLVALDEDYEGKPVAVIELELESTGEMPESGGFGGGRGGRDRSYGLEGLEPFALESTFEIELEGRLLFDPEAGRPVLLELEGNVSISQHTERESQRGGTMVIDSEQAGTIEITVTLSDASSEAGTD